MKVYLLKDSRPAIMDLHEIIVIAASEHDARVMANQRAIAFDSEPNRWLDEEEVTCHVFDTRHAQQVHATVFSPQLIAYG